MADLMAGPLRRFNRAAAVAAAFALKERLAGQRVALILSGGNISIPQLKTILDRG